MDNPRPDKVAVVDEVRERLDAAEAVVLTEYRGLNVGSMAELRKAVREAGGTYKIYKNTLVRFAADALGLEIRDLLTGPTGIAFTETRPDGSAGDAVTIAKALTDFARTHPTLVIKGGLMGDRSLGVDEIDQLAKTPPRDQLHAEFVGAGESFYQEFAGLLDAKLREMSYAMQELLDKGVLAPGEAPPPAEDAPAAEEDAPAAAEDAPAAAEDAPAAEDATETSDETDSDET